MKNDIIVFIDNLIISGLLNNKRVMVFGTNASSSIMINYLLENRVVVDRVLDNNPQVQGSYFLEIEVSTPEKTLVPHFDQVVILIASRYYEEMKRQLESLGYEENVHVFQVVDLNQNSDFNLSIETFHKYEQLVLKGLDVYQRLREKYNSDLVLMSPVKPNGDIYVICSYLNEFVQRNHGAANYVFTVVGKSCELTAKLFDLEHIELLSIEDNDRLVALANFFPDQIKLLNPYHNFQEIYHHLDGYKGLTFVDEIKQGIFGLPEDVIPEYPVKMNDVESVLSICEEYDVVKGKSVIIAPYANSIPLIKSTFWEDLVKALNSQGYKVFTNCGTPHEVPIIGSEKIYFSFEDAVAISEYAGTVISYRSGFCEIIASSKCKKIIIYPDHIKGHSTLRVLFGMEDFIYEQKNLYQITNTFKKTEELLIEVLQCIK